MVGGGETLNQERNVVEGMMWFRGSRGGSVGLRLEIMERMKWEQVRGGWDGEKRRKLEWGEQRTMRG